MKELKTIHGQTFLVDDEDYEKAKQYSWTINAWKGRKRIITILYDKTKHRSVAFTYKSLILGTGSKLTLHKNNNPFDLRKENILVFDTVSKFTKALHEIYKINEGRSEDVEFKNSQSKKAQRSATKISKKTKYFGLDYNPKLQLPWRADINYNKVSHYLGTFAKDEHAALAYDQKALELFGENARRNFPELTMEELTEKLDIIRADNKLFSYDFKSKRMQGILREIPKTSQYVGVCYNKQKGLNKNWMAYITRYGKYYKLGYFYSEEEAAYTYDKKAIELYGEEAKVNFPDLTMEEITKNLDKIKAESEVYDPSKKNQGKRLNVSKTSKYVGVCFDKRVSLNGKKWLSYIHFQGKRYHLGNYYTEEEAAKAYDKKAIELYGEGAKLNLPQLSAD